MHALTPARGQVDWANLQRHNPERIWDGGGTKRKYGVVEHARRAPHAPPPQHALFHSPR